MAFEHPPHEEAEHAAHRGASAGSRRLALLIAVLALCLAISETLGKAAQTTALAQNVEASNLWAFFQAKTIRQTTLRTASEDAALRLPGADAALREAVAAQQQAWAATIARWESEPATGEGRKELAARAKAAEQRRDTGMAAYHNYELGSAAFQVAIVLASAAIITAVPALSLVAIGLGLGGVALTAIGFAAPDLFHGH